MACLPDYHQALFSYFHTSTWADLSLDLAEQRYEADYQTAPSTDLGDRGMLFIIQVLAQSLHYIITVFRTGVGVVGGGLDIEAVTLSGFKEIFDMQTFPGACVSFTPPPCSSPQCESKCEWHGHMSPAILMLIFTGWLSSKGSLLVCCVLCQRLNPVKIYISGPNVWYQGSNDPPNRCHVLCRRISTILEHLSWSVVSCVVKRHEAVYQGL